MSSSSAFSSGVFFKGAEDNGGNSIGGDFKGDDSIDGGTANNLQTMDCSNSDSSFPFSFLSVSCVFQQFNFYPQSGVKKSSFSTGIEHLLCLLLESGQDQRNKYSSNPCQSFEINQKPLKLFDICQIPIFHSYFNIYSMASASNKSQNPITMFCFEVNMRHLLLAKLRQLELDSFYLSRHMRTCAYTCTPLPSYSEYQSTSSLFHRTLSAGPHVL